MYITASSKSIMFSSSHLGDDAVDPDGCLHVQWVALKEKDIELGTPTIL